MKYEALSKYRYPCKLEKVVEPDANGTYHYYLVDVQNKIICSKLIKDEAEELRDILNREFVKDKEPGQPTPYKENTDKVAAAYYASGRNLAVQYWYTISARWVDASTPTFDYKKAWRIKPFKKEVLVQVYKNSDGSLSARAVDYEAAPPTWKLVGSVVCEVEP